MSKAQTIIGVVIMHPDKKPCYYQRTFEVVLGKMAVALRRRLNKGGRVTATELATIAAHTLLRKEKTEKPILHKRKKIKNVR